MEGISDGIKEDIYLGGVGGRVFAPTLHYRFEEKSAVGHELREFKRVTSSNGNYSIKDTR